MKNIKEILTIIITAVTGYFGQWTAALTFFVIMLCVDYITGVISGVCTKTLNSKKGLVGILKKFGLIVVVFLGSILDNVMNTGTTLRDLTAMFYGINDCFSVLENLGEMGIPIPEKIKKVLEQLKSKNDGE